MGEAARVYAEELAKFKFGHPLWWPEHTKDPHGRDHDIEIGDVGYVDGDGAFHVLFNVTHDTHHPLSAGHFLDGVFEPLKYDSNSVETTERFLTPENPVCGSTVSERQVSTPLAADSLVYNVGGNFSLQFKCHTEQGAYLLLRDDATKTVVQRQEPQFIKYMSQYHWSWYLYARDVLGIVCTPEDIILVRGFVKTSAWTVAAFLGGNSQSREVTLNGQGGPTISVGLGNASRRYWTSSPIQRSGPACRMVPRMDSEIPLKDQCVFLDYFKVLYRADLDRDDGSPGLQSEYDVEVERECDAPSPRSPLDVLLEYILEFSDADIAIASYDDLENFTLDDRWPVTFRDVLRAELPKIAVDEDSVGRLARTPTRTTSHGQGA